MDGNSESWTLSAIASRALRIAVGAALFAAVLLILGSSGAFASSGSSPTSVTAAKPAPDKGNGLISGILSPVVGVVDKAVSQVPVVKDIVDNGTVGKVVAPVSTVTDKVESAVKTVPVVGAVVAPVRQITNAVVPPVVNAAESVTTPVLGAVDQAAAPVIQAVAPVLNPVTGTVRPVVGGVTDGVVEVVDTVVTPALPSTPVVPAAPSVPQTPSIPGAPGTSDTTDGHDTSGVPGDGHAVGGSHSKAATSVSEVEAVKAADAKSDSHNAALDAQIGVGNFGALAPYLADRQVAGASNTGESAAFAVPSGAQPAASCGSDSHNAAVGPCATAVVAGAVPGPASGSSAGGSGGAAGPVAADEHMYAQFALAGGAAALPSTDWPLPASMPENPGSTPG